MQKLIVLKSVYRCVCSRSSSAFKFLPAANSHRQFHFSANIFSATPSTPFRELRHPLTTAIGSMRSFCVDLTHMPDIKDPEVKRAFKDLMAASWDELPNAVVGDAEHALTKTTDDKAGQEALINVFRAAEAVEDFTGILTSLKMEIDDAIGLSGENVKPISKEFSDAFQTIILMQNVKPMSKEFSDAFQTIFQRYTTYLNAFGSEEGYLKKKVEMELGTKMIHLKMRCSGLDSEWGKGLSETASLSSEMEVTVLGTSGLAGSYIEQRA